MAGCHLRSLVLLQSRHCVNRAFHRRWILEHSRPFYSISSFHKEHQHQDILPNRRKYSLLLTNVPLLGRTQLRNIHFSQAVFYPDKQNEADGKTNPAKSGDSVKADENVESQTDNEPEKKLTVFQRFKKTYKEHGKVLIVVHLLTSSVWFGTFFYAAKVGVDVIPVMEWLGLPDKVINPFRNSSLGDVALAYLMYKLATPARYTVTLAGTNFAIKYLRKVGKMQPMDKNARLSVLAKDSRTELKKKRREVERKTHKFETNLNERRLNVKVKVKDRLKKFRSKLKEKQLKALANRKNRKLPRSKR